MPSKYPVVKPKELIDFLYTKGFWYVSQNGSHRKYTNGKLVVIVPMHYEIKKGTLKCILSQAQIPVEDLIEYLE